MESGPTLIKLIRGFVNSDAQVTGHWVALGLICLRFHRVVACRFRCLLPAAASSAFLVFGSFGSRSGTHAHVSALGPRHPCNGAATLL